MEKILIDTDLGSDCDDVGAFSLLHNMAKVGKVEILGCTHCASEISGAVTVKAVNEYYGAADLPVGRFTKRTFLEDAVCRRYTEPVMNEYLKTHDLPEFEDAVKTMRRILASNTDVVIVTIGMLNNIAELLRSGPDEISDKTGAELCKASVKCMYSMGGHFADADYVEYNIKLDIESARCVADKFPAPIYYCGFELGDKVLTGVNFKSGNTIMSFAYGFYEGLHESWDPITVYCAANPKNRFFNRRDDVTVSFDEMGRTVVSEGGKDGYYIANASLEEVSRELEVYMK